MKDVIVTYSWRTGEYQVLFRKAQMKCGFKVTMNYHDLSGWISNWVVNEKLP